MPHLAIACCSILIATFGVGCSVSKAPPAATVGAPQTGGSVPQLRNNTHQTGDAAAGGGATSAMQAPAVNPKVADPLGKLRMDPDGNDDVEPEGHGPFPKSGHFEKVGRAPISLRQICDLTPFGDALYAALASS